MASVCVTVLKFQTGSMAVFTKWNLWSKIGMTLTWFFLELQVNVGQKLAFCFLLLLEIRHVYKNLDWLINFWPTWRKSGYRLIQPFAFCALEALSIHIFDCAHNIWTKTVSREGRKVEREKLPSTVHVLFSSACMWLTGLLPPLQMWNV